MVRFHFASAIVVGAMVGSPRRSLAGPTDVHAVVYFVSFDHPAIATVVVGGEAGERQRRQLDFNGRRVVVVRAFDGAVTRES
jgi:hypothetical protein